MYVAAREEQGLGILDTRTNRAAVELAAVVVPYGVFCNAIEPGNLKVVN